VYYVCSAVERCVKLLYIKHLLLQVDQLMQRYD